MSRVEPPDRSELAEFELVFQMIENVMGFVPRSDLNRWDDTLATTPEPAPRAFVEANLGESGGRIGKHA